MQELDSYLFRLINIQWSHPLLDAIMPTFTDLHKNEWFVLVVVPALLVFWGFQQRHRMIPVLIGVIVCVGCVDMLTYRVLKPTFKRERPPMVENEIQLRTKRYAGYSFPSNHAANNFAAASFLSSCYPALTPVFYAIAGSIAYSRVYVGAHYPGDVLAGGFLGLFFGLFFFRIWSIILPRRSS